MLNYKKLIFVVLFLININLNAEKLNIGVTIQPIKEFVQKIAKDKVNISVMVGKNSDPHSYEPKPSQMLALNKTDLYFFTGIEFDKIWLNKIKSQNKNIIFKDVSDAKFNNPHIWTSPKNVKKITLKIYKYLVEFDKKNSKFYQENLNIFLQEIDNIDKKIKKILNQKQRVFLTFHPAWEYFAKDYNLKQISIEIDGKEPKLKELIKIIKKVKKNNIKTIIVQPEFSDKMARLIAKELKIKVIRISVLNSDWSSTMIKLAKAIAN